MCRLSRGVPGTTFAPIPATWSLTAFNQVRPRRWPKYFGEGAALMVRTGTTKRSPSTEARSPPPHACAIGTVAWATISREFAAAWVSARR